MSCGCKTSGESGSSCGEKGHSGCDKVDICGNSYKLNVFDWLGNIAPATPQDQSFVEVRFKNDRKAFYKNVNALPLSIGSVVTVEASPGHDVGVVSLTGELVKIQMRKKRAKEEQTLRIFRHATSKDVEVWQESRKKENSVKTEAKKIAQFLRLDMKITDVEYQGDGGKITFYYTADGRVDFRQLIKDLASAFRTKIDMKQIGFRQEAAKIGGIGSCGRELCCSTWLTDFRSVNTQAARYQQLSINPQKLAGQCGKLKCCLNFELDSYMDALSDFPSSSTTLDTEKGKAFCVKIDVFRKKMWYAYSESPIAWFDLSTEEVKNAAKMNSKGKQAPPLEDLQQNVAAAPKDIIQEERLDRFEKKNKKNYSKNNNRKPERTDGTREQKPRNENGPKKPFQKNSKKGNPNFQKKRNNDSDARA